MASSSASDEKDEHYSSVIQKEYAVFTDFWKTRVGDGRHDEFTALTEACLSYDERKDTKALYSMLESIRGNIEHYSAYLAIMRKQLTITIKRHEPTWPDSAVIAAVRKRLNKITARKCRELCQLYLI